MGDKEGRWEVGAVGGAVGDKEGRWEIKRGGGR